ncbi:MAG: alpha/beta fold hydrolase [Actinobacteria bacterium]|nr:alpha/beta fold hydrolase [Actinomycetota bacterium]
MHRILFNHGYTNKRPVGHWMRLSAAELRNRGHQVWYPQFPNPDIPVTSEWQSLIAQEAAMMDEVLGGEKIAIAHSLGCMNWLLAAREGRFQKPFDRVLLVAPPDPQPIGQNANIEGEPLDIFDPAIKSAAFSWAKSLTVIASEKDHWLPRGIGIYEQALETKAVIFEGAGHFSLDDGFGKWQGLWNWIETADPRDLTLR